MKRTIQSISISIILIATCLPLAAQSNFSTARIWNEMVLTSIRNDFARPTAHARNLFHSSIAMYDAWAIYNRESRPYLIGQKVGDFESVFEGVPEPDDVIAAQEEAMSYAVYRLIRHRFKDSPGKDDIFFEVDLIFRVFGYDAEFTDTDYADGNPAALGNFIAEEIIAFGLQDGSNEINDYANQQYQTVNPFLDPFLPFYDPIFDFGNPRPNDPNRWQQMMVPDLRDQAGNPIPGGTVEFLGAEWGEVQPFALQPADAQLLERDSQRYRVYHDPGPPPLLDTADAGGTTDDFVWGFAMVAQWDGHTVGTFNNVWDISPASIGNQDRLPQGLAEMRNFYDFMDGGDNSPGHDLNPYTGEAYEPHMVPRVDFTRVVAQYWADGPESETPPGHWFTLLNEVNDREELVKKFKGEGEELGDLEWDVKSYLALGGAMHDAAVAAWSIKGYYDYVRPISAIRYLADRGQSSDPEAPNYDPLGIPLIPGTIEQIIEDDDPLLLPDRSNFGKVKTILARGGTTNFFLEGDRWLPYQPINFITPPFAGYISGHSTFSRAAAEVLTSLTGDPFFPGGLHEVEIPAGTYLRVGLGPSQALNLQWATYRDAANQSGLSRIWGGIHPPVDDIAGRWVGIQVGEAAFELAEQLFEGTPVSTKDPTQVSTLKVFPNPIAPHRVMQVNGLKSGQTAFEIRDMLGRPLASGTLGLGLETIDLSDHVIPLGVHTLIVSYEDGRQHSAKFVVK